MVDVEAAPAPSPKFQDHASGQSGVVTDRSVNWNTVIFFLPLPGLSVKSAAGLKHVGDGLGEGVGVGVGPTLALGSGVGLGVGTGVGIGVGVGAGSGDPPAMDGRTLIWA